MAPLTQKTVQKSDWRLQEEARIAKARAGHASFNAAMSGLANNAPAAQPARKAFLSGIGGTTDAPTAKSIALTQKADRLPDLPANAKKACEHLAPGIADFVNTLYRRHAETKEAVSFTMTDAGKLMGLSADQARACVEALASKGVIRAAYSGMGVLKGYVPALTN